jgi:hypothetical protein
MKKQEQRYLSTYSKFEEDGILTRFPLKNTQRFLNS